MNVVEAHVWRVCLNEAPTLPSTAEELERAAGFRFEHHRRRYLRSHAALRAILRRYTEMELNFAIAQAGKPYLPTAPGLRFNLSHSDDMALVGISLNAEIGVDIEHIRPLSDFAALAERFFPPSEAAEVIDEADFFRRWTRIEAVLKARGVGLNDIGTDQTGRWTVEQIDAGPEYSAAVALPLAGAQIRIHDFRGDA